MAKASNLAGFVTSIAPVNNLNVGVVTATSFVGDGSGLTGAGSTVANDTTTNTTFYPLFTTKTDGTLWSWGYNGNGQLGQNNRTPYSSPVQIPRNTWATSDLKLSVGGHTVFAIKNNVQ